MKNVKIESPLSLGTSRSITNFKLGIFLKREAVPDASASAVAMNNET